MTLCSKFNGNLTQWTFWLDDGDFILTSQMWWNLALDHMFLTDRLTYWAGLVGSQVKQGSLTRTCECECGVKVTEIVQKQRGKETGFFWRVEVVLLNFPQNHLNKQSTSACQSNQPFLVWSLKSGTLWLKSMWLYKERLIKFKTYTHPCTLRLITFDKPIEPETFGDTLKTGRGSSKASCNQSPAGVALNPTLRKPEAEQTTASTWSSHTHSSSPNSQHTHFSFY